MSPLRAKALRKNQTRAEARLWTVLRNRQLCGLKFRRQVSFGPYIADFICHQKKLVVEVDGGQHASRSPHDSARAAWFEEQGYRVVRFWNNEVLENLDGVLEPLSRHAK